MKETIKINEVLPEREQAILDTALLESDQLLARSLHDDQRRRRRRTWLLASVFGGVVMSGFFIAFLLGVFSLAVPDVAEAKGKRPTREAIEQAEAYSAEGWQLWKKQDHLAAATKFEKSVELNPKAANAWNGYGWALFNSGQSTKALRAFERCVKLSPKHPAGLNGLGQIHLSRGEYKQAEKWLKKSAKNPQASAAWHGLARVYLLTGKHKKALPWAKKVAAVGSANDFSKKMLAAAQAGELSDELRAMLEPITAQQGEEGTKGDIAVPTENPAVPEAPQTQEDQDTEEDRAWTYRLLALKEGGHWSEGAQAGMELLRLPGDRPYKILKSTWPKIATSARKQILKGFTPGMMGNKEMHPGFFDVMDLGMSDKNPEVRSFAANYLKMQGLPDYEYDLSLYKKWCKETKGLPAKELMKQVKAPKRSK